MTDLYRRFAGLAAMATAAAGVVFTVTFAIAVREGDRWALWASSIALIVGGLVAIPVVIALAEQLGTREPQFARLGLVLGLVASMGTALHGAWDTAVLAHPADHPDVPSYTDPRGFATFATTALGVLGLRLAHPAWHRDPARRRAACATRRAPAARRVLRPVDRVEPEAPGHQVGGGCLGSRGQSRLLPRVRSLLARTRRRATPLATSSSTLVSGKTRTTSEDRAPARFPRQAIGG